MAERQAPGAEVAALSLEVFEAACPSTSRIAGYPDLELNRLEGYELRKLRPRLAGCEKRLVVVR